MVTCPPEIEKLNVAMPTNLAIFILLIADSE